MSCVVGGCRSHSSREENNQALLTFHRFPKDELLKREWLNRIGRENWIPRNHSHICSKHFTLESFEMSQAIKWRRLRKDAVPTLFIISRANEMKAPIEDCKQKHSLVLQIQRTAQHQQPCLTGRKDPRSMEEGPSTYLELKVLPKPLISSKIVLDSSQECLTQMTRGTNSEIDYITRVKHLEKELERVKKICKRRLRKINTLTKRVSRLGKQKKDLFNILLKKVKNDNIETE